MSAADKSLVERLFHDAHEADDCGQPLTCDPRTIISLQEELQFFEAKDAAQQATIERLREALDWATNSDPEMVEAIRSRAALNEGTTPSDPSERNT